jgi:hypothetical protein
MHHVGALAVWVTSIVMNYHFKCTVMNRGGEEFSFSDTVVNG